MIDAMRLAQEAYFGKNNIALRNFAYALEHREKNISLD